MGNWQRTAQDALSAASLDATPVEEYEATALTF